jgi:hypothetical protein
VPDRAASEGVHDRGLTGDGLGGFHGGELVQHVPE